MDPVLGGYTVIAVALLIGLGALGTGIGFAILGGKFLKALPVSQSLVHNCKPVCSS